MAAFAGQFRLVVLGTGILRQGTWFPEPAGGAQAARKPVVLGTFGDVVLGTCPAWFWEPRPVVTGTGRENFLRENKDILSL